jgi:hypothetical protein
MAAFRAALAFAIVSLNAFEDLATFLVSISDCCSSDRSAGRGLGDGDLTVVEAGFFKKDGVFVGVFRVFFT